MTDKPNHITLNVPPGFTPDMEAIGKVVRALPDGMRRGDLVVLVHLILRSFAHDEPAKRVRIVMQALSMFDDMRVQHVEDPADCEDAVREVTRDQTPPRPN